MRAWLAEGRFSLRTANSSNDLGFDLYCRTGTCAGAYAYLEHADVFALPSLEEGRRLGFAP